MKSLVFVPVILLLTGCLATVPVKQKFPDPVPDLMASCPDLQVVPDGTTKLSEAVSVVTVNYGQYHLCRIKVELWIEWYNEQKKIYDEVK